MPLCDGDCALQLKELNWKGPFGICCRRRGDREQEGLEREPFSSGSNRKIALINGSVNSCGTHTRLAPAAHTLIRNAPAAGDIGLKR